MTPLVVDESIAIKWLPPEVHSAAARRVLREDNDLLAPDLLWAELGNVLWKRCRAGEIGAEDAGDLLRDLRRLPIGIIPSIFLVGAALDLAMRFNRTVSDSLYPALAMGRGCRIITANRHPYAALRRGPLAPALLWVGDV